MDGENSGVSKTATYQDLSARGQKKSRTEREQAECQKKMNGAHMQEGEGEEEKIIAEHG